MTVSFLLEGGASIGEHCICLVMAESTNIVPPFCTSSIDWGLSNNYYPLHTVLVMWSCLNPAIC